MPKNITDIIINMPHEIEGPVDNRAGTWAKELLALGASGDYDRMTDILTISQQRGCLYLIRAAAQEIVKKRTPIKRKKTYQSKAA